MNTTPPATQPAPAQEPVCQKCGGTGEVEEGGVYPSGDLAYVPCECTTPPAAQRQWVGLTDDEMDAALRKAGVLATFEALHCIGREVEAKLKEKNT